MFDRSPSGFNDDTVGLEDGMDEGDIDGIADGSVLGTAVVGEDDGRMLGAEVGIYDGAVLGI